MDLATVVLRVLYAWTRFIFTPAFEKSIPMLQRRKLRYRNIEPLVQGHMTVSGRVGIGIQTCEPLASEDGQQ